jgi:hypothetical protein
LGRCVNHLAKFSAHDVLVDGGCIGKPDNHSTVALGSLFVFLSMCKDFSSGGGGNRILAHFRGGLVDMANDGRFVVAWSSKETDGDFTKFV